jgi:hypothetical protein
MLITRLAARPSTPGGDSLVMRTRICWREDEIRGERPYAAAHLIATIEGGDDPGGAAGLVGASRSSLGPRCISPPMKSRAIRNRGLIEVPRLHRGDGPRT